jgi:hypothetical protein
VKSSTNKKLKKQSVINACCKRIKNNKKIIQRRNEAMETVNITEILEINKQDRERKKDLYRKLEIEVYGEELQRVLDRVRYLYGLGIENIKIITES